MNASSERDAQDEEHPPRREGRRFLGGPSSSRDSDPHPTPGGTGGQDRAVGGQGEAAGADVGVRRDVLILRDPRESLKKCSLTPLRGLAGVTFVDYRADRRLNAAGRVLLHPDGEPIGPADRGLGLLLVDCAWRRVEQLLRTVDGPVVHRRLPPLVTAYPRVSKVYEDPVRGLASVEALYGAAALLQGPDPELLAGYRWAERFLELNPDLPR